MQRTRMTALNWALLAPSIAIVAGLLVAPIGLMGIESLRPYVPGRATGGEGWTLRNYTELLEPAYAFYFWDTFRTAFLVSAASVVFGAPLAWLAARTWLNAVRVSIFGLLVGLLFMSLVARLYAIEMTWGSNGPLAILGWIIGINPRSPAYAAIAVFIGLLHFVLPITALMLIGTFQNISPRLEEAAASLGAPRWKVTLGVTLPLAVPGLLSAFMIAFAMCISNFIVPLILGRGVVLFASNLMYVRFTDVANFPSGAAIGIVMFVLAALIVFAMTLIVARLSGQEPMR